MRHLLSHLKIELQSELQQARIPRLKYLSESRVREVAVRVYELRLIEYVEDVRPELEVLRFCESDLLGKSDVPLIFARTTTNGTWGCSELTEGWILELGLVRI